MRKYRNTPTIVEGIRFDSKAEAKRWQELKLLERAGEIEELERQPVYHLLYGKTYICKYIGDFRYVDNKTGKDVVEDVKGVRTAEFRIKAKLFEACFGFPITEVKA